MKKTLTYGQALDALNLLDRDPDDFPSGLLSKVLVNRKRLKTVRDEWQEDVLPGVVDKHHEEPLEVTKVTEDLSHLLNGESDGTDLTEQYEGQVVATREGPRGLPPDSEHTPLEVSMFASLDDPEATDREIGRRLNETVEVELSTASLDQIKQIEGVEGSMDALEEWHFMLEE